MNKFLIALAVIFAGLYLLRTPETKAIEMMEKYTNEHSLFTEANGLRVHYRDQGNRDGAPLVLLHGSSASLHTWEPLVAALGSKYRIITLTQPGHGLTGPHPRDDYSADGMAEALDLVTDELGLENFTLGGNSMGGWVAWRYALANPQKINALILLDAAGMPLREGETAPPLNLGFRLQQHPVGRFLLLHFTPRSIIEKSLFQTVAVKSIVTDEMVDLYWELIRFPGNRRATNLRATTDHEAGFANQVQNITAPTLVIWGQEDTLIFASAATSFDERLANAQVVIYDGVGHLPMEEAPGETAHDIDAFLHIVLAD